MTAWNEIRSRAAGVAADAAERRGGGLDATAIRGVLDAANLPGLLGLAASGTGAERGVLPTGDDFVRLVAESAAKRPEIAGRGVDAEQAATLLRALLVDRRPPADLLRDPAVRDVLLGLAMQALEREAGVSLSEEERRAAVELLASGQLVADAASAMEVILMAVPGLLSALPREFADPPALDRLAVALGCDVGAAVRSVPGTVGDLVDGRLDRPPAVLRETLGVLFARATVRSTADTMASLLDNRSVRLAIVAYARVHGVPVHEDDLLAVRKELVSPQPALGPLLSRAVDRLASRYGGDAIEVLCGLREI